MYINLAQNIFIDFYVLIRKFIRGDFYKQDGRKMTQTLK